MKNMTQEGPFSSNAVRLSLREWLTALLIAAAVLGALPAIWRKLEAFPLEADYRIPYKLSEDYWLFQRFCRSAGRQGQTLVIGDSFVWGQYVLKNQTLVHYLNEQAGVERFVNLGLDGGHPLALGGLIEYYGADIKNKNVILHLNLLWLSSPEADLRTSKELRFNHPRLAPQFFPRIPCYKESTSGRIGVVLERSIGFAGWVRHLGIVCFDGVGLQQWSQENPYVNPAGRMAAKIPASEDNLHPDPQSWKARGQNRQSLPWVNRETSLQWRAFERLIALLEARRNRVFILVGPLNEHMLEAESLDKYKDLLRQVESWLKENNLPYDTAPLLPSDLYADLSHPLSRGYEILALRLAQRLNGRNPEIAGRTRKS